MPCLKHCGHSCALLTCSTFSPFLKLLHEITEMKIFAKIIWNYSLVKNFLTVFFFFLPFASLLDIYNILENQWLCFSEQAIETHISSKSLISHCE